MQELFIAWWNLENLFDTEDSTERTDKLKRVLGNELKGWSESILQKKIGQLSKIICRMNDGKGPDVLGICEVENKPVVQRLINSLVVLGRSYQIIHADTQDERGIDVAFIYDSNKLHVEKDPITGKDKVFSHFIMKRLATRDIIQVNFITSLFGKKIILIGNHWPSRMGGQFESEPYRIVAGESLSYFHSRISQLEGQDTPIVVMGDFNDEPFNRSVTDYALSTSNSTKVTRASQAPRLLNLMWPKLATSDGTFYHEGFPNILDQFMISKAIIRNDVFAVANSSAEIIRFPEMVSGVFRAPVKFGRPSDGSLNEKGYSDHLPISVIVVEE